MKLVLILFLIIAQISLSAQVDREPPPNPDAPLLKINNSSLYGKIVDSKTLKGLEAASVQVFAIITDSSGLQRDSLVAAMLTKPNGDFRFENLPNQDSILIMISISGYKPITRQVEFGGNVQHGDDDEEEDRADVMNLDLGNISMQTDVQELGMVTVIAQKPALEMGIDRKIFNVDKSLVSTGGTGLDVMKRIPSVSVDLEGNITLRNTSPQIFVDGRPTILTLDQIPADNIERVELITNPSAKFDAASGGGIINVILKRNKRVGLNGILTLGAGTPNHLNGNATISIRDRKFNYFGSASYFQSGNSTKNNTFRQNKDNGSITDQFNQNSITDRLRRFGSFRFGFDYFIDNRNTISVTQNIVRGKSTNEEDQDQQFLDASGQLIYFGVRNSDNRSRFNRNNTQLNFTHKFPEDGKEFTANLNYNSGDGNNHTNILNLFLNPDGTEYDSPAIVRNQGDNNNKQWTIQADLVNPYNENSKLEAGIRTFINNYGSIYNAFAIENGSETKLPLSNNYKYRELINAAYTTYTGKIKSIGYQLGLRTEYSRFDGELVDSSFKFGYRYPNKIERLWDAFFPSIFLAKEIGEEVELQLNYSRRIRRPGFNQLNPFIDINDPVNLQQGNPQLRPEFINSFEFNYSQDFGKGSNFLGVIYYRNNPGDITRYSDTITAQQYQQLNNAAVDPNAILNTFINAQSSNRLGLELTLQLKLGDHFEFTPAIDMQYQETNAKVNDLNLSNEGFSYEADITLNYRTGPAAKPLFRNFSIEMEGDYESPEIIPQGKRTAEYQFDIAFRKDFLKDKKANLTLSISDLFNTQRFGTIYDTERFYQDSRWRRNVRGFRLVFTYKFGDSKFTFRRNNQENNSEE